MSAETKAKTTDQQVREAVLRITPDAELVSHETKAWASITFRGTRHELVLKFPKDTGEDFVARLPDYEFAIPRQLVADATVTEVVHRWSPQEFMQVSCVLLLLEED